MIARLATWLKYILLVGVTLLVVLAVTAAAALVLIDPNDYRDNIEQVVERHTGRNLDIEGEIALSLFPWLGVELGALELGNAQGFGEQPMARIEAAELRVKLLPLLRRQIEVGTLVLDEPALALARDSEGHSNWDDLLERLTGTPSEEPSPGHTGQDGAPPEIVIHAIVVREAGVQWDDRLTDTQAVLRGFNLQTGRVAAGQPFDIQTGFELAMEAPAVTAGVALGGVLMADPAAGRFAFDHARLTVDLAGEDVPGGEQRLELAADSVNADLEADAARLEALVLEVAGVRLAGGVHVSKLTGELPVIDAPLTLDPFSPREVAETLALELPPMADTAVLQRAGGRFRVHGTAQRLAVSDVVFEFDDSTLRGSGVIEPGEPHSIIAGVQLDAIDADRYLPPEVPPSQQAQAQERSGRLLPDDIELPVEPLSLADFDIRVEMGELRLAGLVLAEVTARARNRGAVLRIDPLTAQLYEGSLTSEVRLDGRPGRQPSLGLMLALEGLQAGPLVQDLLDKDYISGDMNLRLDVTGTGADTGALRRTLAGDVAFSFEDGLVHEFDLARQVNDAYALYRGRQPDPDREPVATEIGEASGTGRIDGGVLRNEDLQVRSPVFLGRGEGRIDLVRERLDYVLTVEFIDETGRGIDRYLAELRGVPVPVHVRGALLDPAIRIPVEDVLEARAREELRREQERVRERAEEEIQRQRDELEERARDQLRELWR